MWIDINEGLEGVEINDSDLKNLISANYYPGDIFNDAELEAWAESNGFVKEEEGEWGE